MAREFFNHSEIEAKTQKDWEEKGIYVTDLTDTSKDPYYLLIEFPYPSGDLHVGHWYAFAITDIYARFMRMQGKNVLYPFGFDAFGLPAENAAIKRGLDPKKWTYENMDSMREQVRSMGASFDWTKEIVTSSPEYYKWTQWLFSRLFEHGLAERRKAPVKWCPQDQTVLANEQVIDGTCERCGHKVEERILTQWFLGITKYADRLLSDLDALPWREDIKDAQRSWIGKSEGAKVSFALTFENDPASNDWRDEDGRLAHITVFTTRPDTLYGVSYIVLAPEHPLVAAAIERKVVENADEILAYVENTKRKTERERMENKEKTGVRLKGILATNPLSKEQVPVFVADYVLASYGTGAVMAVPAHDDRDFEFAQKFNLPSRQVVAPRLVQTDEPGAFKHNQPVTVTSGIIALVQHWSEEKYLALRWKNVGWTTLMTGGMEGDDSAADTALRELREETGYTDATVVKEYGIIDGLFYHVPKAQNRLTHGYVLKIQLASDAKVSIDAEEEAKHELVWRTREELQKELTAATHQHAMKLFFDAESAFGGSGTLINSGEFTDRESDAAMWDMIDAAGGERTTNYRLRDWLVSRQRYWGCPIPVVYDPEGNPHLVPSEHLPWTLPEDVDFTPTGKSPLATSKELAERVERIFGEGWTPEYDTLDTFVDSSWYFTRYLAPTDADRFSNPDIMKNWLPVDRYSGGSEHTTMHLLYSRFFYKAMYDLALVPTPEPFYERFNRGLIMGPDGQKMSKSKGNVINPDEFVKKYGADSVRTYLAFIGPYNEPGNYPWKPEGVLSIRRFLDRCYSLKDRVTDAEASIEELKALAKASAKMAVDIERFKLNTAVSSLMILLNSFEDLDSISATSYKTFMELLAPFAPHLAEHLYKPEDGDAQSIHQQRWPAFSESLLQDESVVIGVQVAGKRRGEITISPTASEEDAVSLALSDPSVATFFPAGAPSRVIYREGKILNLIP